MPAIFCKITDVWTRFFWSLYFGKFARCFIMHVLEPMERTVPIMEIKSLITAPPDMDNGIYLIGVQQDHFLTAITFHSV